jgi:dTDP-4-dehydrorhamnose reductase
VTDSLAPIAVTGARGRLGSALLVAAGSTVVGWSRPEYDLDRPESPVELLSRDRPRLVIHPAAMTDVDACARDPELALRRNGGAVGDLARACVEAGAKLVLVSTNEVFGGDRVDGRGYLETDEPRPRNPYGTSKLAGEEAARTAFDGTDGLWIVRTAWLYGPPGASFPEKIVSAADRLPAGDALGVVDDEYGSPTLATDLARAILALVEGTRGGVYHLVNEGQATRLEWARRVLAVQRPERRIRAISGGDFQRASDPPPWGVLDTMQASRAGIGLRRWEDAVDEYVATRVAS